MPASAPAPNARYAPPRPYSLWSVAALMRSLWRADGNLLDLLPAGAYRNPVMELGFSRRSIALFNEPALVREILEDDGSVFPKSDLMVGALDPLIGRSIFVTDGEVWARQRAMIDPAFTHMRIGQAYSAMQAAAETHAAILRRTAEAGEPVSLDRTMGALTADVICRTTFSLSLDTGMAMEVFEDFDIFEKAVAQVEIMRLILDPAWKKLNQPPRVLAACQRIRDNLGSLIDGHLRAEPGQFDDIASTVIANRDAQTGQPFSREELIDQLGVFFLAGHETTASVLTWLFFILAQSPQTADRIREEARAAAGDGPVLLESHRQMPFLRAVFRETMRLYPPVTFLPRVALRAARIGPRRLRRGALVMVSPWTLHRNARYWHNPDRFDPGRFMPGGEAEAQRGAYIPFGLGPHTCVGAGFAQAEALLIVASLLRDFDFEPLDAAAVRPAARLTTRPAREIMCRVKLRH
jgi:cytochrome P450